LTDLIGKVPNGGNKNCIKILVTDNPLGKAEAGWGAENLGIALNPEPGVPAEPVLPHEVGHFAGYNCGNADASHGGKMHSKDAGNVMYSGDADPPEGGRQPDACWCARLLALSRRV
jgi:hypothetical protein